MRRHELLIDYLLDFFIRFFLKELKLVQKIVVNMDISFVRSTASIYFIVLNRIARTIFVSIGVN